MSRIERCGFLYALFGGGGRKRTTDQTTRTDAAAQDARKENRKWRRFGRDG
nr:MAG TPA: hypothetical protein [Caudoviricetes sp.]